MQIRMNAAFLALGIMAMPFAAQAQTLGVEVVAEGLDAPVFVASPPGDDRLFIVDQPGVIWVLEDGSLGDAPFLDIRHLVECCGERGLLGLAFHPNYAENGRFFLNYTEDGGHTLIAEYTVSDNPNVADPGSARRILGFEQPAGNHNGGWIGFGPDGYLYIATGDGGRANDVFENGQNPNTLLGAILRIDIDNGDPYAIPPENPWADGNGGAPEIFAWGLRNPWRVSFDGEDIYIADVGQGQWEEITVITTADAGANLGWNIMEGNHCFQANQCDQTGLVLPVHEYSHAAGCSVTGGYVYRGAAIPAVQGHYFFGDYCAGFVSSFRVVDGQATEYRPWSAEIGNVDNILSFGVDAAGEIYITSSNGRVYKIVPR